MLQRSLLVLLYLLVPAVAVASGPPVEASMVVTGTITVDPQGGVSTFSVHDLDKLPSAARQILQTTVPHWQFVPIMAGGKAVSAKSGMVLRIVADKIDAKHWRIRIAGAQFGCEARPKSQLPGECPAGTSITYKHRQPPSYPYDALQARVGGEVFLVLQIGGDGHVTQAAVRQVNLYTLSDDPAHFRKVLADASVRVARRWTFLVPTTGPNAAKDHWVVQVPINYTIGLPGAVPRGYGQWSAYVPGPVQQVPWDDEDASGAFRDSADAIAGGGAPFVRDRRFVLKTPPGTDVGQS